MEKQDELGALWIRKGNKGEFMTGVIKIDDTAHEVVCFTNQNKKSDRHPDWRVYKSRPKEEREESQSEEIINPNDIPF